MHEPDPRTGDDRRRMDRRGGNTRDKVPCPECRHGRTSVNGGWPDIDGRGYVRQRKCENCRASFTTIEQVDVLSWTRKRPA